MTLIALCNKVEALHHTAVVVMYYWNAQVLFQEYMVQGRKNEHVCVGVCVCVCNGVWMNDLPNYRLWRKSTAYAI